ncbi:hypothetical protein CEXT_531681 [Caerostris extrusa]|uniref:Uncharacterized protein n=1 Tax=Caerostris extrusa TaxID=172846 RepID=A0AAV4VZA3_CAEEX|nr:hypothetical protein CEXT_531681 [Caerostris extrusa]
MFEGAGPAINGFEDTNLKEASPPPPAAANYYKKKKFCTVDLALSKCNSQSFNSLHFLDKSASSVHNMRWVEKAKAVLIPLMSKSHFENKMVDIGTRSLTFTTRLISWVFTNVTTDVRLLLKVDLEDILFLT